MQAEFLEQIVDSLSDALITVDQDRRIVVWNHRATLMFGYEKSEVQARGLEAIIPPAYRERHRLGYDRFVAHIHEHSSYVSEVKRLEALRKSGETFPVELTHSMFKVTEHEFYISVIVRDISDRKRYEVMRERLEHITRHDLKNKLVIISLAADRLSSGLDAERDAQASKYLEIVRSESKDLLALLDSTRELILMEAGEYRRKDSRIDLTALLHSKAERLRPMASDKQVAIEVVGRCERPPVFEADRQLLERALENLIKNAIEAEDPGGTVQLILAEDQHQQPFLEIRNGGEPIAQEIRDQLFSPYVTHGKKDGTGLGLYSAKLILETVHGWELDVRAEPDHTVFIIRFGSRRNNP